MRIFIAALIAAVVIFIWQAVAHMMLPLGTMGFRLPAGEDPVLQSVVTALPTSGIYLLPSLDPAKMGDKPTMDAWADKAKKNPFVFAAVSPPQDNPATMTPQLVKQFIGLVIGAFLVAWVLAATSWSFGGRVIGAVIFGVFGWLMNIVPLWTWYRFPSDFIVGNFLIEAIGWLLGGIAIAWWLGRRPVSRF